VAALRPLPSNTSALRADVLALLDAVAAHAVAPAPGVLWAPRWCGHSRADALAAARRACATLRPSAASARGAPLENKADGHAGKAPPAPPNWRTLLAGRGDACQRDLSRAAPEARHTRHFTDPPGWARTLLAAVQGGCSALSLTSVPADSIGRGMIHGPAMRVATRL